MLQSAYILSVYGPFQLTRPTGETVAFPARSASAVLAYLTFCKGKWVERREIGSVLWPDQPGPVAMANLRQAIHRVRKSVGADPILEFQDESLRVNPGQISSDLEQADRLHRAYLLSSSNPDGIASLQAEWEIRRAGLLSGWDFEWLEDYRVHHALSINDLAAELARAYEGTAEFEKALALWHWILEGTPHHAEALQNALRLEFSIHGRERALALADRSAHEFSAESGLEMPRELARTVKAIRTGMMEQIPRPELFRTRSDILLLANLFESNLRSNQPEALALLARESSTPLAQNHPRGMLSLLQIALGETAGTSPDRLEIAAHTVFFASLATEFEVGHRWADFVVENTSPSDSIHGDALSMKGFMLFEQRHYDKSEAILEQAIAHLEEAGHTDRKLRAMSRLAGVRWHRLKFEEAISTYKSILEQADDRRGSSYDILRSVAHGNLCFVYAFLCDWDEAVKHGAVSEQISHENPYYKLVHPLPYGLALFMAGQRKAGLELLSRGLRQTCREGLMRFNQIGLDFAAVVLHEAGRKNAARAVIEAGTQQRAALRHHRSPAEVQLLDRMVGSDPNLKTRLNPSKLVGQPPSVLSEWVCEQFEAISLVA